jgi:hypothetical protein
LAALLETAPCKVNSNMQEHGQYWMQINTGSTRPFALATCAQNVAASGKTAVHLRRVKFVHFKLTGNSYSNQGESLISEFCVLR